MIWQKEQFGTYPVSRWIQNSVQVGLYFGRVLAETDVKDSFSVKFLQTSLDYLIITLAQDGYGTLQDGSLMYVADFVAEGDVQVQTPFLQKYRPQTHTLTHTCI